MKQLGNLTFNSRSAMKSRQAELRMPMDSVDELLCRSELPPRMRLLMRDMPGGSIDDGAQIKARLFGSFSLETPQGEPILIGGRKSKAILAICILSGFSISRDRLAALLWSDRGEEQARASLRQSLHELRSISLGGISLLRVDREMVALDIAKVSTDLDRLRACRNGHDAEAVAAEIGEEPGDLLAGFDGLAEGFDAWLAAERSRRHDERRQIVQSVTRCAIDHDRTDAARRLALILFSAEPFDEGMASLAMEATGRSGDREGVRRIFARYVGALSNDLSLSASPEMISLRDSLLKTSDVVTLHHPSLDQLNISANSQESFTTGKSDVAAQREIRRRVAYRWLSVVGSAVLVTACIYAGLTLYRSPLATLTSVSLEPLPADRRVSALFLQARDDWAERSAASLERSIQEFQRVTRLEPSFAPAFADLADSYLLAGEAGSLPPEIAFDGAQHAADQALRLNANSAAAHRAVGFILYWWKHDAAPAGVEFRKAIRLDPADGQTHFWYANALADNGEAEPAMREFGEARLADPGSDQIGSDFAWARWISGHDSEALASLRKIIAEHPANSEAQDCLSIIALAHGDYGTYLNALKARARLRHEQALDARVEALDSAFLRGGGIALLRTALSRAIDSQQNAPYPDHASAAFYASLAGDRAGLLRVLGLARSEKERWGSAGYVRIIKGRWKNDWTISNALGVLEAPAVEPHPAA